MYSLIDAVHLHIDTYSQYVHLHIDIYLSMYVYIKSSRQIKCTQLLAAEAGLNYTKVVMVTSDKLCLPGWEHLPSWSFSIARERF